MENNNFIIENLFQVEENIRLACKKANRNRNEITLIAVSKTKPNDMISSALQAGIVNFGENKVQEMCDKFEYFNSSNQSPIHWHMIGHLQTNKVKYLVGKTTLIHSVDSYRLACEIEKQAAKHDCIMDILIEVNIAEEESKFGLAEEDVIHLVKQVAELPHIRIKGLMTVAPYVVDSEENRPFFRKIKQLSVDIDNQNIDNVSMNILSMGMTGDYMVAIEEGATMVRVGTGIFGERNYNI